MSDYEVEMRARRARLSDPMKYRALLWGKPTGPGGRRFCLEDGWGETEQAALRDLRRKTKKNFRDAQEQNRAVGDAMIEEAKRHKASKLREEADGE